MRLTSTESELIGIFRGERGVVILEPVELELQPGDPGEVAAQLNIQPNNLKVRRHRARQALKQRLEVTGLQV